MCWAWGGGGVIGKDDQQWLTGHWPYNQGVQRTVCVCVCVQRYGYVGETHLAEGMSLVRPNMVLREEGPVRVGTLPSPSHAPFVPARNVRRTVPHGLSLPPRGPILPPAQVGGGDAKPEGSALMPSGRVGRGGSTVPAQV